ncbi:hypothetical protein SAMN05216391_11860 [Lachnospiraceae bacterium KHCPX20]|nr:hypothetical protein SAMN05216391_11860 [Lachnospiraceae bacterium KHCPX20]
MVQRIIDDIRGALDHDLYYVALNSALTLPDICGKAEFPDEPHVWKRYIDWYNKEIGYAEKNPHQTTEEAMPYLSGEVMYSLRCSLLHSGIPNVDNEQLKKKGELPIDHFTLKIEKKMDYDIYSDSSEISTIFGQHRRSYTMSIRRICGIMCAVAEQYYKDNKDKFSFNYNILDWDKEVAKLPPLDIDYEDVFKRIAEVKLPSEE